LLWTDLCTALCTSGLFLGTSCGSHMWITTPVWFTRC